MAPKRYKSGHRITSGGNQCPTCSWGKGKSRGISASLGKSQLSDLESQEAENGSYPPKPRSGLHSSGVPGLGAEAGLGQGSPARMSASSMKWVLNTVTRLAFLLLSRFQTMWREQGSIPAVGSSSSKTWGQKPPGLFKATAPELSNPSPAHPEGFVWNLPVNSCQIETSQANEAALVTVLWMHPAPLVTNGKILWEINATACFILLPIEFCSTITT